MQTLKGRKEPTSDFFLMGVSVALLIINLGHFHNLIIVQEWYTLLIDLFNNTVNPNMRIRAIICQKQLPPYSVLTDLTAQ